MSTSRLQDRSRNAAGTGIRPQPPTAQSLVDFRARHGDPAQWDARDFEAYLDLDGERCITAPTGGEAA